MGESIIGTGRSKYSDTRRIGSEDETEQCLRQIRHNKISTWSQDIELADFEEREKAKCSWRKVGC